MTLSCVMSAGAVCQIFHVPQRALCPALVIKTSPPSHSPYNTPTPGLAHSAASLLSLLSDPAQISRVTVCNPQSPTRNFISKFHRFNIKKKMNISLNHVSSSKCQGIRFQAIFLGPGVGLKCISRTRVTLTQISAGNAVPGFAQSPKYDDAKKSGNHERFIHPGSQRCRRLCQG